jgi:SAM-dependent methyltransferase
MSGSCSACGNRDWDHAFSVAGDVGAEGLIPTTDRFGTALSDIVRCRVCGHMQLAELPSGAVLLSDYEEAASADYLSEEPGQRRTARALLERLERRVTPGALLDAGCWLGFLLDEARVRGWEVTGLEPSRFAAGYARERLGLHVLGDDLMTAELPGASFDAVVLADVIEHLPDPGAGLERISTLLRPGGILVLVLPDAGSRVARVLGRRWWSVIPTHVQYFTRGSLSTLLQRHGWELLEVGTAPKAFTVRYYLERIGGYSGAVSRSLVKLADVAGLSDRLWAPDFLDRMHVLARAPR